MTGEMHSIDQTGKDSNGDIWPLHLAIAKAIGGELQPFDVYQGPYISVGGDAKAGSPPYVAPVQGLGIVRLWVHSDDGVEARVYREDTDQQSEPFPMFAPFAEELAANAARSLMSPNQE